MAPEERTEVRAVCQECEWQCDRHNHIAAGYSMAAHHEVVGHTRFSVRQVRFVEKRGRP